MQAITAKHKMSLIEAVRVHAAVCACVYEWWWVCVVGGGGGGACVNEQSFIKMYTTLYLCINFIICRTCAINISTEPKFRI